MLMTFSCGDAISETKTRHNLDQAHYAIVQKFEACKARINQKELNRYLAESEMGEEKLDRLCQKGQRAKAQLLLTEWTRKWSKTPTWQQLKKCVSDLNTDLKTTDDSDDLMFDPAKAHACDDRE